jgi:hypothetical protein
MRLKRRIAALLAFVMAFSSVATFSLSADTFAPANFVPASVGSPTDITPELESSVSNALVSAGHAAIPVVANALESILQSLSNHLFGESQTVVVAGGFFTYSGAQLWYRSSPSSHIHTFANSTEAAQARDYLNNPAVVNVINATVNFVASGGAGAVSTAPANIRSAWTTALEGAPAMTAAARNALIDWLYTHFGSSPYAVGTFSVHSTNQIQYNGSETTGDIGLTDINVGGIVHFLGSVADFPSLMAGGAAVGQISVAQATRPTAIDPINRTGPGTGRVSFIGRGDGTNPSFMPHASFGITANRPNQGTNVFGSIPEDVPTLGTTVPGVSTGIAYVNLFIPAHYLLANTSTGQGVTSSLDITLTGNAQFRHADNASTSGNNNIRVEQSYGVRFGGTVTVGTLGTNGFNMTVENNVLRLTQITIPDNSGEQSGIAVPLRIQAANHDVPITLSIGNPRTNVGAPTGSALSNRYAGNAAILLPTVAAIGDGVSTPNFPGTVPTVGVWDLGANAPARSLNLTEVAPGRLTNLTAAAAGSNQVLAQESALRGLTIDIGLLNGPHVFARGTEPVLLLGGSQIRVFSSHDTAFVPMGLSTVDNAPRQYDGNGVIMNLRPMTDAVNARSYAFFSHDDTRLNIVLGPRDSGGALWGTTGNNSNEVDPNAPVRTLNITELRFQHREPFSPTFAPNVQITVGQNMGPGYSYGTSGIGGNTNWSGNAVSFENYELAFRQMGSPTAAPNTNNPEHSGNRFWSGFAPFSGVNAPLVQGQGTAIGNGTPVTRGDIANNWNFSAGVRLVQPTAGLINNLIGANTFTLVDAEGNILDDAIIAAVFVGTGPSDQAIDARGIVINHVSALTTADLVDGTHGHGEANVAFSPDGRSVTISGITPNPANRNHNTNLNVRFAITTDPNFSGNVYVQASGGLIDTNLSGTSIVQIATVEAPFTISVEAREVALGVNYVVLNDITITENSAGAFMGTGANRFIELRLDHAFGGGQLSFAPVNTTQARQMVTTEGNAVAAHNIQATLQPFTAANADVLRIDLTRNFFIAGTEATTITISGVRVGGTFNQIPRGIYGFTATGTAITNVDAGEINTLTASGSTPERVLTANQPNFRRYGHGPLRIENVFAVGVSLDAGGNFVDPNAPTPVITVGWAPGTSMTINGATQTFANGMSSIFNAETQRIYFPITELVAALGGTFDWDDSRAYITGNRYLTTVIPGAANETVTWIFPHPRPYADTTVMVEGLGPRTVTNAPFLGVNEVNPSNNGRTMIPVRGLVQAHGLVIEDGTGSSVINVR